MDFCNYIKIFFLVVLLFFFVVTYNKDNTLKIENDLAS